MINHFTDAYRFLSNDYYIKINYDGATYSNAESAFQASKVLDPNIRKAFESISPVIARKMGDHLPVHDDWNEFDTLYHITSAKFKQNPGLMKRLLATGEEELMDPLESRYLGKILMRVRRENAG